MILFFYTKVNTFRVFSVVERTFFYKNVILTKYLCKIWQKKRIIMQYNS